VYDLCNEHARISGKENAKACEREREIVSAKACERERERDSAKSERDTHARLRVLSVYCLHICLMSWRASVRLRHAS
jgi:hypothetical protein